MNRAAGHGNLSISAVVLRGFRRVDGLVLEG